MRWLHGIIDSMDMNSSKPREMEKDREARHAAVHGVTKSWTWLNINKNKNMIFPLSLHRFKWGSLWRGQIHRLQSKLKDSGPPETVPSWGWEVAGALGSHACGQCPHHGISNAHTCPSPGCPLTWRSASVLPSFPTKMVFATSCHSYEIQGVMRWGGKPGNYVGSTPASLVPSLWQQLAHPCTLAGTWVRAVACVVVTSVTKWPEQELNY